MVVRKILEATLVAGSTSVTFTDTDIPNSLLRVYCSRSALFPISQTLSGNSVTVTYKPQDSNIGVALEIVKQGLDIVDNVTSEDTDKALSAKQGKLLKDAIDNKVVNAENVTYDNTITGMTADDVQEAIDEVFQSVSNGKVLIADAITDKGVPTSATDSFSTMATNISNISSGGGETDEIPYESVTVSNTTVYKNYTIKKSGTLRLFVNSIGVGGATCSKNGVNVGASISSVTGSGAGVNSGQLFSVAVNVGDSIQIKLGRNYYTGYAHIIGVVI